jgi:dUTP pyrophosphatase
MKADANKENLDLKSSLHREASGLVLKWQKLHARAEIPAYATSGAAAFDIKAAFDGELNLHPGSIVAIPTGLAVEVPPGYELQVRARSGLALKFGFTLVNGVGTIDADYRGEIRVIATLLGREPLVVRTGDRIAQGLVAPVLAVEHCEVASLSATERGAGGFGSTGV